MSSKNFKVSWFNLCYVYTLKTQAHARAIGWENLLFKHVNIFVRYFLKFLFFNQIKTFKQMYLQSC